MKNQFRHLAMTIGLSAVLGSSLLVAQTGNKATADIPFGFQVKDKAMPAGAYSVNETPNRGVLQVRNEQTGASIMVMAPVANAGKAEGSKLVFNRYGDRYFLSQIWFEGEGVGHGLGTGRLEKEIAVNYGTGVLASIRLK